MALKASMKEENKIDWAWISRNLNLVMFIAIIVLILLLLQKCNGNAHLKQAVANGKQNQKALLDSLRQVKNRAGELQAEKLTLIATAKELELLNKGLYDEVKKQKGTVIQLTASNAELRSTIRGLQTNLEPETTYVYLGETPRWPKKYRLNWSYDSTYSAGNYTKLSGFSRISLLNDSTLLPGLTDITENTQGFKLITGLRKEGDDYQIFVKSDHPGFNVSNIEGAIIPGKNNPLFDQPKKWGLGVTVGPNFSYGYGIGGQGLFVGVGATFGIHYNIIKF
jgi:hypothetical protein